MTETALPRAQACKLLGIKSRLLTVWVATRRIALSPDGAGVLVEQSRERIRAINANPEAFLQYPKPTIVTRAEFAEISSRRPSYIFELMQSGRLVMAPDGKMVRVAESLDRIEATRDPSKQGVADRHAAARAVPPAAVHDTPTVDPEIEDDADALGPVRLYDFHNAKAKREHWAAEREHAAFRKDAGELIEHTAHVAAMADIGATVRAKLEAWANTLPPQLAGRDEAAVRATLADQVELLLREMADRVLRHASAGQLAE